MRFTTRFAPSPTGPLHLGHAYSALLAFEQAKAQNGRFLLRIEDIDQSRARPHWEAQIYDDLAWLGLSWPTPVMRQSERLKNYNIALQDLWNKGLIYSCTCNRRDILNAMSAPQEGADPAFGPDGLIYPGTCRTTPTGDMPETALRLNVEKALDMLGDVDLSFTETDNCPGPHVIDPETLITKVGDIVLARKDMGTSYHLSVVLDDAAQNITHVTRGADLFDATQIHVLLQRLLNLPTPIYTHHRLIRDENGKRLAKRDDAKAIAKHRADGATADDLRSLIGL